MYSKIQGLSLTFGKGLIQSLSTLSDGSGLAITVAGYQTPSGRDIQSLGIEPDRFLDDPEPINPGSAEDRWLNDAESLMGANLDMQILENASREDDHPQEPSNEQIEIVDSFTQSEQ